MGRRRVSSEEGILVTYLGVDEAQLARHQREALAREECSNVWFTQDYTVPLLRKLFTDPSAIKILSLGCGVGQDVETMVDLGYDCWGIEPGYRRLVWQSRVHKDRLVVADGRALPFEDQSFDVVLSFGVLEHVGQENLPGIQMAPTVTEERQQFANELIRVTCTEGYIIISTPNKHCPIDFWDHGNPRWGLRPHCPWEQFTVSLRELKIFFITNGRCKEMSVLPLEGAFKFQQVRQRLWGKILYWPGRLFLRIMFHGWFKFLASSPLNPFLIVWVRK